MNDPLLRFRERFPILSRTKYLVSHSLGAMPEATREALAEYTDLCATRGAVVRLPTVTAAEAVVLSSYDYTAPRNRVVIVDGEFPSVRYIYARLARRLGAEIVTVPHDSSGLGFDLDRMLAAIDERTQLVPTSHIPFESSHIISSPP